MLTQEPANVNSEQRDEQLHECRIAEVTRILCNWMFFSANVITKYFICVLVTVYNHVIKDFG